MLVDLRQVTRTFTSPNGDILNVLSGLNLQADAGETRTILGRSGCGKSTLLSILGLLDRPDSGCYVLDGSDTAHLSDTTLSRLRGRTIGFVYQRFFLLRHLSAAKNIEMALLHAGLNRNRRHAVMTALEEVGLAARAKHKPAQLSGGEQQRVAIARALVTNPRLILADEPTGALDTGTAAEILDLLSASSKEKGACLVAVTHDLMVAERLGNVSRMVTGRWAVDE